MKHNVTSACILPSITRVCWNFRCHFTSIR